MRFIITYFLGFFYYMISWGQQTPFEKSGGKETATYFQAIEFYNELSKKYDCIKIQEMGPTDAGYPLHLILLSNDKKFDPVSWHEQNKVVILINNGIHPGEPDGIDASMMLVRNILQHKEKLPDNVVLGVIPIYNIGGSLNRNSFSRANQNGPISYGFRGNAQNLDLNRDFTKNDTRNARSFAQIFHFLNPDILVDNHVSDGADYQHTMTLITTQYDKLGGQLGDFLKNNFEPSLYKKMTEKGWDMTPYINFETAKPDMGFEQFYDPPRYSSGYGSLFQTISFMPETHMLKPFSERVRSTFDLMITIIAESSKQSIALLKARKIMIEMVKNASFFPLGWIPDSVNHTMITFKGYEQSYKLSDATGLQRMYYDHTKPYTRQIKYYNHFIPTQIIKKPKAYIIPQGWWAVIDILKLNSVIVNKLGNDTTIKVEVYQINDYKSLPKAYEKHHKNFNVKLTSTIRELNFKKGDYIINTHQCTDRYVQEMLEPSGDDSFFAWNFFDAVLQQKEGYSDYRWEDIAAGIVRNNPGIKEKLDEKKQSDSTFKVNSSAQLEFIYKNSPYYESAHLTYPVYRLL